MLEQSLTQVLRDVEIEREAREKAHQQELDETRREAMQHRQAHQIKARDLSNIKRHAKLLLKQRSELEQFFYEALATVKTEVRDRNEAELKAAKAAQNRSLRQLAMPRGTKLPELGKPASPQPQIDPNAPVELSSLGPDDRERVLKLLFARINGMATANDLPLPAHSFDVHITEPQQPQLMAGEGFEELLPGEHANGMTFLTDADGGGM